MRPAPVLAPARRSVAHDPFEWLDRVDESDNVVGRVVRNDPHLQVANLRVVHVLLFNEGGEVLLQRVARGREAGSWGSSVAGHLRAGEPYAAAAKRELFEELGIHQTPLRLVGKFPRRDGDRLKFVGVYTGRCEGPFSPDPSEVSELAYFTVHEIREALVTGRTRFTAAFIDVLHYYLSADGSRPDDADPRAEG